MKTDIEISRSISPRPISEIAEGLGTQRFRVAALRAAHCKKSTPRCSTAPRRNGPVEAHPRPPRSHPTPAGEGKTDDEHRARSRAREAR